MHVVSVVIRTDKTQKTETNSYKIVNSYNVKSRNDSTLHAAKFNQEEHS
jgi:hypothetical protein